MQSCVNAHLRTGNLTLLWTVDQQTSLFDPAICTLEEGTCIWSVASDASLTSTCCIRKRFLTLHYGPVQHSITTTFDGGK